MRCPVCEGETPGDKPFCANCGAGLVATCTRCGAELLAGKAFCADCGTPVDVSAHAAPAHVAAASEVPSAERRLCSVLFVDLVGFTPLAEKADPEEVRELLSRYFETAQGIVANYGGTVEKFIGDAVMAVWGAPVANEDDAERSVRAALEMVASVTDLGREVGHEGLAARAGVVTGEVAITVGKVQEGMVLGDTVNSASRVQGAAAPGTVLVDEATWRSSSGAIAYTAVGDLVLKGKEEPVAAWQALRVVAQRKGLGRSERLEPPFVGRGDELRLVKDLLHATIREQRSRLVSITGVPGIGKSRLAWEFLKYVDGLAETVYWHQGRSATYGEGVTFGALGEMVRMRAGINEAEGAESSTAKLAACVADYVGDDDERRWIEPRLAHLLGLADAPGGDREELFSAWRAFFERISSRGVTVLVFEDLQWADPGLIDFIESILEWSRNHPIMVVTLSRPELRDRRPDWGAGQRSFTSLHLDPLSHDEMRELLVGFVSGLPDAVAAHVLDRAEGVPLYAVETVRMLVDRGVLVADDGVYRVEGELPRGLEIPETLHALVASRLDALPADQRALLQDAAVLGTTFHPETLAVVHGLERDRLDPVLRDLVRKEFLRFDTDPRSPERGQYGFVQGVIAEVALSMLSRRDRSAKHLLVAGHFESLADEELIAVVAAHYYAAYRASPDGEDTGQLARTAGEWLTRAGERSSSLGSPEQAAIHYTQALEITPAGAAHAQLLERAADAFSVALDRERAQTLLDEAVAEYRALGDLDGVGRATAALAQDVSLLSRRFHDAAELARAAYDELGSQVSRGVRGLLAVSVAGALSHGEDLEGSLAWSEIALEHAEATADDELLASAIGTRSMALFSLGRHREAVILARGMVALAIELGAVRAQARALMGVGLYSLPDDPQESVSASLESAAVARKSGHRQLELSNLLNATESMISLGRLAEARRILDDMANHENLGEANDNWIEILEALYEAITGDVGSAMARFENVTVESQEEFTAGVTTTLNVRAILHVAAGDLVAAQADSWRAIELDPMGINSSMSVGWNGRVSLWLRDPESAQRALDAGRAQVGRWMTATCLTIEAGLAALAGDADLAADRYTEAIDRWRALDCTLDLALCELDMVVLLGPDHPASVAGKEAEDIFTQLGAKPYLARLDAARAATA